MSESRSSLPEDLELMAPGPQLAAVLGSVDRRLLSDTDRVRLAQARNRLASHVQGELLADLYAVTWGEPPVDDELVRDADDDQYPWAQYEVAFALRWTGVAAGRRLEQARQLAEDLPVVLRALSAGMIDMPKALVISELAGWLEDRAAARAVVDRVIEQAPGLTTGQLRAKLRRLVLAVDPDAARRRCAQAVRTRRVETRDNPDGSGDLWGRCLPPQDVAAAWERLTAIARSARAAGDGRTIDQLRADALLDLLVGEGVAAGEPLRRHTGGLADADRRPEESDIVSGMTGVADGLPAEHTRTAIIPTSDPSASELAGEPPVGPHDVWPDPAGEPVNAWDEAGRAFDGSQLWPVDWPGGWVGDPAVAAGGDRSVAHQPAANARSGRTRAVGGMPGPRRGVIELQVSLYTLLGLDDQPAELAGFGPVLADVARQVARDCPDLQWRFSVYDEADALLAHGITSKRPTGIPAGPGSRPAPDRGRRRPSAAVAAFVRARSRTCVAPGCRRPARDSDLDHTIAWEDGGRSEPGNLGPGCRGHHMFKHAAGSSLAQSPDGGTFRWTTPRGMRYVTVPEPPLYAGSPDRPLLVKGRR